MELSERNIKKLEDEGFTTVYEWFDESNKKYEAHSHDYAVTIIISEGSMSATVNGETIKLISGDRIDIPSGITHAVLAGTDGCKYVIAER